MSPLLALLTLPLFYFSSSLGSLHGRSLHGRVVQNPDPTVGGSLMTGWEAIPPIPGATLNDWVVDSGLGAKIPVLQSSGLDASKVKRAIIVLPGNPRDCWNYWNLMNNALLVANANNSGVSLDEVSVMAPCFFEEIDRVGALASDEMSWGDMGWAYGDYNTGPSSVTNYSSFSAMDSLVQYYLDPGNYPSLNVLVIAGHSAGGQMVQRYLGLRKSQTYDERLHFWIANPASYMWLTESHPIPAASGCNDIDEYKYGLSGGLPGYSTSDYLNLGRDGIVARYLERQTHYALGLEDDEVGDTACEAQTQGGTHLERGQKFQAMLQSMPGGIPANTTFDYVPGVGHDNAGMMNSPMGIDKLFYLDYNTTHSMAFQAQTTTSAPGSKATGKSQQSNGEVRRSIDPRLYPLLGLVMAIFFH